ncbi:MAG: glycosyl hydrolase [Lachnospiraceae bacterium]|nr:glycosyl hydrolase [Lachnospiraceae bacterium]
MVDLTKKPFDLNEEQISWVEETFASMTLEEKIGQLFICMNWDHREEQYRKMVERFHVGGIRWQGGSLKEQYDQNKYYMEHSKIPVLIAANLEAGAEKSINGGTLLAPGPAMGAGGPEVARLMADKAAEEAKAVGVNWTFAPITDVVYNWRNTIVNNRAFGNDPDGIIADSLAYMEGAHKHGIACCCKHFPGDGVEERDHHLVMGCNDLSVEEWEESFGKVYRAVFEAGVESVMVGHICMPAWQKKLNPALTDEDIMPATLSPELVTGVLRGHLGFNGLITTDASHMAGLSTAAPRSVQVPGTIAAGCDMFLFFNDPEEDYGYMMDGYRKGIITEERLSDAVHRILGLKAKLNLHHYVFPSEEGLKAVGCEEHHEAAAVCADKAVTLVKDTQHILPIDPAKRPRAALYYVESAPVSLLNGPDKSKQIVIEELERAGFTVDAHEDYYEMECRQMSPANAFRIMDTPPVEEFKKKYDVVFMFVHMKGYAQENNVRLKWSAAHSSELPWFVHEVPTVGVSLNYTNHLYDLPMLKTFVNAYAPTREYIRAAVEKITGKSAFNGKANDLVWCGRWDTRR